MSIDPIRGLADHLIREGYVDNEPDALLAAIRLHLAITARGAQDDSRSSSTVGVEGGIQPRSSDSAPVFDIAELMMHRL